MMRKRYLLVLLVLAVVAVAGVSLGTSLLPTPAQAQQPEVVQLYGMTWDVVASGGATMSSDSYTLLSTSGQAIAGTATSESHTLYSGYWQRVLRQVLLPLLNKN